MCQSNVVQQWTESMSEKTQWDDGKEDVERFLSFRRRCTRPRTEEGRSVDQQLTRVQSDNEC